jgi:hypothetical protein
MIVESKYVWIRQKAAKRGSTPKKSIINIKAHDQTAKWNIERPNARRRSPKENIRAGRQQSPNTDINNSVSSKEQTEETDEEWQKPNLKQDKSKSRQIPDMAKGLEIPNEKSKGNMQSQAMINQEKTLKKR